jgi:hypothetical protein
MFFLFFYSNVKFSTILHLHSFFLPNKKKKKKIVIIKLNFAINIKYKSGFLIHTIGFVIRILKINPKIVANKVPLLKSSLNTSNVFDGASLVNHKSNPYASTKDVDSSNAGDVIMCLIPAT